MTIPLTPRRSKRFQPLATPSKDKRDELSCSWTGEPIYVRPTNFDIDVLPEEKDEYTPEVDNNDAEEGTEHTTCFFDSFQVKENKRVGLFRTPKGTTRRNAQKDASSCAGLTTVEKVYRVGDTVLVETSAFSNIKRAPSVAVIVAMWDIRLIGGDDETMEGKDGHNVRKMRIRIHWFLRPSELARVRANRETLPNEIFYSLASAEILFPEVIVGHCSVTSAPPTLSSPLTSSSPSKAKAKTAENKKLTSPKKQTRASKKQQASDSEEDEVPTPAFEGENQFCCRFAVNSMRGIFYAFDWNEHHLRALGVGSNIPSDDDKEWGIGAEWDVAPPRKEASKGRTTATRRAKRTEEDAVPEEESNDGGTEDEYHSSDVDKVDSEEDELLLASEEDENSEDTGIETDDVFGPRTPRKRRRRTNNTSSPRKRSATVVHPTPHSKRRSMSSSTRKGSTTSPQKSGTKRSKFRMPAQPPTYVSFDISHLPHDPWLRAMNVLHVGSRPDALPCREEEFKNIMASVGELLEEGSGGCIYISGVPGTGKTATVHAVIRELKRMAKDNETNPFTYVEINGLKIPEPFAAYGLLWEGVSGHDVVKNGHLNISAKDSLKALTQHFNGGGGRARGPGGHACVVLMDELDQLVTAKQDVVYNFFNWPTLVESKLIVIAVANTMDLPERVMSGRVRSRLGMIRINFQPYTTQQLERIVKARLATAKEVSKKGNANDTDVIAPDGIKFAAMKVSSITGDARRVLDICRRTVELVAPLRKTARTADVKEVIQAMQNSPTAAYLRDCSFHERLMLASIIKCIKREGVDEIKWSEVQIQHLIYMNILPSATDSTRKPSTAELSLVLESLVATRALLFEDRSLAKADGERRVLLNLEQSEVERVLSEMGGTTWKSVLSN